MFNVEKMTELVQHAVDLSEETVIVCVISQDLEDPEMFSIDISGKYPMELQLMMLADIAKGRLASFSDDDVTIDTTIPIMNQRRNN